MMLNANILPVPGIVLGAYPERRRAAKTESTPPMRVLRRLTATADSAFALISSTCERELGLKPHPTQLVAARIMLDGRLAEMATGEGKTLAAGICAATAALAGVPVHVITANDYLVSRDADFLRPLYSALGLRVAAVTHALSSEERRHAYDADIVYCTASELAFDYLRDGLVRGPSRTDLEHRVSHLGAPAAARGTLLRGLCMAIVDEADSILIDEARVPLILSESCSNDDERRHFAAALDVARALASATHYTLNSGRMSAELTPAGCAELDRIAGGGLWLNRLHRDETVCTALTALNLYEKDRHYLVRDGAVTIIDESTGRLAAGRIWSRGLHRMIEIKEGCPATTDTATIAQITYQRFFQRYLALGGMSGTLTEARRELASVYGLKVSRVPLYRPDCRKVLPTRIYIERESMWQAVVTEALRVSRSGRPVLIGTDSVAESEALSQRLSAAGIEHAVLNARHDADEARVVAEAGERGRITVATNMAGRGTDIALAPGVAELGGLHVISCQHNASRRIDRQLLGRCARRGDPGSAQTLLALDKPLIARHTPAWLAARVREEGLERPQWLTRLIVRVPQLLEERRQRGERRALLQHDLRAVQQSSFASPTE
jgi:preprotein translocase subunit SecA